MYILGEVWYDLIDLCYYYIYIHRETRWPVTITVKAVAAVHIIQSYLNRIMKEFID